MKNRLINIRNFVLNALSLFVDILLMFSIVIPFFSYYFWKTPFFFAYIMGKLFGTFIGVTDWTEENYIYTFYNFPIKKIE